MAAALQLIETQRQLAIAEGLEEGRQGGYDSGYLSGHEEGLRQGREEAAAALAEEGARHRTEHATRVARWDALIASAEQHMKAGIEGTEAMLVEIAFEAVAHLLGEAMTQRDGARAAVINVIARTRVRELLVVRVAPADLAMLDATPESSRSMLHGVQLLGDARVSLGGCLLETSGGTLDGRLETQLQALQQALLQARASRDGGSE